MSKQPHVIIIGAGLGGLASAIYCASKGLKVTIFEKNSHAGGKCNLLVNEGFSFDLGPSILLLPDIFRSVYQIAGKRFDDYVSIRPLDIQWRSFFGDGTVIDLYADYKRTSDCLAKYGKTENPRFEAFCRYAIRQYTVLNELYLNRNINSPFDLLKCNGIFKLFTLDLFRTMHGSTKRFFKDKHLIDIFDYFIKYVGSSAYKAPAFMNLLSGAQFSTGLWYVNGGIYNIVRGYLKLIDTLDIDLRLNSEVKQIVTKGRNVSGVVLHTEEQVHADAVISNMEVIPAYKMLLPNDKNAIKNLWRYEPSCSGLVIHLGIDKVYTELAHHNFFFSKDQRKYFHSVFEDYELPEDPTIYVVAPSRSDLSVAPSGYDTIKILPHIPHLIPGKQIDQSEYEAFGGMVIQKLERMGLHDLRKHIVVRDMWTPYDIYNKYYSNAGSIYGVVTDFWKNYAFKAPRQSRMFKNLFFAGGSVNPGGGMPMVTLSGMHAGKMVVQLFNR